MSPAEGDRQRLLVVDDDPGMCRAVVRVLGARYQVETAQSAGEAAQLLTRSRFAAALVDVQLNDGDGYTLCQQIRTVAPETDVILMTGSVTHPDEKLFRSLEEGAFYFLFKPFERRVLRALVDRCLRIQSERRAKQVFADALAADLDAARRFAASLLPGRPMTASGWSMEGRCRPCDALGGDFFLYQTDASGAVDFAICDIVGHGVKAAMCAGMVRAVLDAARRRDPDPAEVLHEVANGLAFFEPSTIVTLVYGQLLPDGLLRYFNAGHPPMIWQRHDGATMELGATGVLLSSAFNNLPRTVAEASLAPGDRLITFTDGLLEAHDPAGHELELSGLVQTLQQVRTATPPQVIEAVLQRVDRHRAGRPLDDDATMLIINRQG